MYVHSTFLRLKKPIYHRFIFLPRHAWIGLFFLSLAAPTQGAAPTGKPDHPLTEPESIRLALERPAIRSLAQSQIALAESEVTAAGRWPNPEIEYSREQVNRPSGDSTEESFWLTQRFELSGQRGLHKEAAEHRLQAAALGTKANGVEIAADTRARFFRVLYQQMRLGSIEDWTQRLAEIGEVIRKRQRAGEVSGYDTLRMSTEQAAAQATFTKEQSSYKRAWAEFSAIVGGPEVTRAYDGVAGQLLPNPPGALETMLEAAAGRPDIAKLAKEAAAQELERSAGERGWVPELTVGIGRKSVDDDLGVDSGPMIAAGITIPLFDRSQAEVQRAFAGAEIARNQHQLALTAAEGEIRGRWNEVTDLINTAWSQHRTAHEEATRLVKIAEVAYRGGEIGILELLDAYRGAHEAQLQVLETAVAARQAQIELDRLTGGLAR